MLLFALKCALNRRFVVGRYAVEGVYVWLVMYLRRVGLFRGLFHTVVPSFNHPRTPHHLLSRLPLSIQPGKDCGSRNDRRS